MEMNKTDLDTPTNSNWCSECNTNGIIYVPERGEYVCANCGLVHSYNVIDGERQGRRSFSMEEKEQRDQIGSPISALLPHISLSTVIDNRGPLSQNMRRIIKWNSRMSWDSRNMLIASTEIKRIGTLLNFPKRVKEYAAIIYRKAFNKNLLRGRSIKGMVAAALYFASRAERIPRTLQEILEFTDANPQDVRRCYRTLVKELKLKVPNLDPVFLVPKYTATLELSNDVEKKAVEIIKQYYKTYPVSGKDPKGIVAAAIYCAALIHKENCSQRKIATHIKVTEVTLRSRYKEMSKMLNLR